MWEIKDVKEYIELWYGDDIKNSVEHYLEIFGIERSYDKILEKYTKIEDKISKNIDRSFLVFRITEFHRTFTWLQTCLLLASYNTVFRELRFMIDAMVQAFYIDHNHPNASVETKFEILKALGNYGHFIGGSLINKTKLPKGLRKKLRNLYGTLSNYVHPSYNESKDIINIQDNKDKFTREDLIRLLRKKRFDSELLNFCIEKCKDVMNAIGEIISNY